MAGCSSTSQGSPFEGPGRASIQIVVENRQFSDATIYVLSDSGRERLGIVTGKGSETFSFRWLGVRELRIEIDMLAGQSFRTQPLSVTQGDSLRLYVERPVYRSVLER